MVVRLRLSRFGCKNKPFYRVMAADSRSLRGVTAILCQDGGKRMGLNFDRINLLQILVTIGAQPSEPVQNLLFRAGVLPPPPMLAMGHKGGPRDTRPIDPLSGHVIIPKSPSTAVESGGSEGVEIDVEEATSNS